MFDLYFHTILKMSSIDVNDDILASDISVLSLYFGRSYIGSTQTQCVMQAGNLSAVIGVVIVIINRDDRLNIH